MDISMAQIVEMVSGVDTYLQTHLGVHIKYEQYFVCQSYLSRVVFFFLNQLLGDSVSPKTFIRVKNMWHIYTIEYYSAIKKNETMPFAGTWMDLEMITLSEEVRKRKTNTI